MENPCPSLKRYKTFFLFIQRRTRSIFSARGFIEPLMERKKILRSTLVENNTVQLIYYTTKGKKLWDILKKKGVEGVIAKKKDSSYQDGVRSSAWLKIKFQNRPMMLPNANMPSFLFSVPFN
jgi:hypothetical protein